MADASKIGTGKPKVAGGIYRAPLGTALPTDTSDLASTYVSVGYISEDGVSNDGSRESEDVKAWGGVTVMSTQTEKNDIFSFAMLEVNNVDVLKMVYGEDNVSADAQTGMITIKANDKELEEAVYVIDMIIRGYLRRIVIPDGKLSNLDEITYKDDEPVAFAVEITALPYDGTGWDGDTHKEFVLAQE